ncbi:GNAT family N-acetyltransferase [Paenibacillus glycanilyticus]|uniref:GNAT family N-acetyltransferase n=1 Tax=Paenibacillus glycanilyticus TaxID=126569 RepID=A0ABQ6GLR4_9BACL|nr:GNAT family N-acetyltransferase [Paenibacillus glycanilyticus]GLX71020.1 GNAT family N-acetyltransferase [Paenibacillus glycanilyticus]
MELTIRNIYPSEFDLFIEVLIEGARWIAKHSTPMWSESDLTVQRLMDGLTIDNFYAAFEDGKVAAVMILQEEDSFFWPEDRFGDALYIHKLCIRRQYAKTGLVGSMLAFAEKRASSLNKSYLKLDCASDRPPLRQLYELHGFQLVGEAYTVYPTAFYQLKTKSYA